ncbi:MAG: chorismate-binding protein [Duncaniella sp.]|nr:chorismate-binding protein [Duncaniella sp.]
MNHSALTLSPDAPKELMSRFVTAVGACLTYHFPFALFSMPGSSEMRLMAMYPDAENSTTAFPVDDDGLEYIDPETDCFFIGRFGGDEERIAGVRDTLTLDEILAYKPEPIGMEEIFPDPDSLTADVPPDYSALISPTESSTHPLNYSKSFKVLKERLRTFGGKMVLSRIHAEVIVGSIIDQFRKLHSLCGNCFRYLCFTRSTGVWIGATPEVLLHTRADAPGHFYTMALAGTRPADAPGPWDSKNIDEQRMVVDGIRKDLESLGLTVSLGPTDELRLPSVKHILTKIEAEGDASPLEVLNAINPTPATLGWPRDLAESEVDILENHQRYCYAGAVGCCLGGNLNAFVNLRCAFAKRLTQESEPRWLYNFYAGGGITIDSVEEDEWEETQLKIDSTRQPFLNEMAAEYSIPDNIAPVELPF